MKINESEKIKILLKVKKWKKFAKLMYFGYFPCWLVLALGIYNSIKGMITEDKTKLLQGNALTVSILLLIFFSNHIAKLYLVIEKLLNNEN